MAQMNKNEYIKKLKDNLSMINQEDLDDALNYVEEYFEEAGPENEQKVIEELGPPHRLAATIRADSTIKNTNQRLDNIQDEQQKSGTYIKSLWFIILGIFALPIGVPIIITVLALIFTLFITTAALVFSCIMVFFALIVFSIPSFISAFMLIGTSFNSGVLALGISFLSLGFGLLFMAFFVSIFRSFIPWAIQKMGDLFQRLKRRKVNNAKI